MLNCEQRVGGDLATDHQGISHISVTMVTVTYYYLDHNDDDDHK